MDSEDSAGAAAASVDVKPPASQSAGSRASAAAGGAAAAATPAPAPAATPAVDDMPALVPMGFQDARSAAERLIRRENKIHRAAPAPAPAPPAAPAAAVHAAGGAGEPVAPGANDGAVVAAVPSDAELAEMRRRVLDHPDNFFTPEVLDLLVGTPERHQAGAWPADRKGLADVRNAAGEPFPADSLDAIRDGYTSLFLLKGESDQALLRAALLEEADRRRISRADFLAAHLAHVGGKFDKACSGAAAVAFGMTATAREGVVGEVVYYDIGFSRGGPAMSRDLLRAVLQQLDGERRHAFAAVLRAATVLTFSQTTAAMCIAQGVPTPPTGEAVYTAFRAGDGETVRVRTMRNGISGGRGQSVFPSGGAAFRVGTHHIVLKVDGMPHEICAMALFFCNYASVFGLNQQRDLSGMGVTRFLKPALTGAGGGAARAALSARIVDARRLLPHGSDVTVDGVVYGPTWHTQEETGGGAARAALSARIVDARRLLPHGSDVTVDGVVYGPDYRTLEDLSE
jgi:hypothetical protein